MSGGRLPETASTAGFWLATWFGAGLSPIAPGTVGTLATVPLHFALMLLPAPWHFGFVAILAVLGTISAESVARARNQTDPQIVVVDESAGVLLALFLVRDLGWSASSPPCCCFAASTSGSPGPSADSKACDPPASASWPTTLRRAWRRADSRRSRCGSSDERAA